MLSCAAWRRDLDGITNDTKRMELALRGVFAGNIFDLGAAESIALFNAEGGVRCYAAWLHEHVGCITLSGRSMDTI